MITSIFHEWRNTADYGFLRSGSYEAGTRDSPGRNESCEFGAEGRVVVSPLPAHHHSHDRSFLQTAEGSITITLFRSNELLPKAFAQQNFMEKILIHLGVRGLAGVDRQA